MIHLDTKQGIRKKMMSAILEIQNHAERKYMPLIKSIQIQSLKIFAFFISVCSVGMLPGDPAPALFHELRYFIPPEFEVLDSKTGDLNQDGLKDIVLILKAKNEDIFPDSNRPVFILFGNFEGKYKMFSRNKNIVFCKDCGGGFGDPYQAITIKNNFFSIEHYGGSSRRWSRTVTFKFEKKLNNFVLHKDEGSSMDVLNLDEHTSFLHNEKDFHKMLFSDYTNVPNENR